MNAVLALVPLQDVHHAAGQVVVELAPRTRWHT
jgi:hypothetical protein